jgi:LysR family cyn operon transcriptional activator
LILRHIRYLLAVAEHRNFTRAADALHVSQPALSQFIRQLEAELGGQLFDRSGRVVRLTDFGSAYVEHVRRALVDLEAGRRALHDVRDLSRGQLRLAFTPTFTEYLVAPLVRHFNALYPGIALDLKEDSLEAIEKALTDDQIDVAIGFADVRSAEIEVEPLFSERLLLVVGGAHPLVTKPHTVTPQELAALPLALLTSSFSARAYVDSYFQSNGIRPRIALQANSISVVLKIVRGGEIATVLPSAMQQEHADLTYVPLDPAFPGRTVALLKRKGAYSSAASSTFSAILREMLSSGALSRLRTMDDKPAKARSKRVRSR